MRKTFALVLPVLALSVSGCLVQSLHPLYRDQDLVFQSELVGRWTDSGGSDKWDFSKSGDRSCKIVLTEANGDHGVFEGRVLKLDRTLFLDLTPDDMPDSNQSDVYSVHRVPTHSFFRIDQLSPTPSLTPLDYDWMAELLKKTPGVLKHEVLGQGTDQHAVLTASTPDLQAFMKAHVTDHAAFKKPMVLQPQKQ